MQQEQFFDEEDLDFDLHAIVKTIWGARFFIAAMTIALALITFVVYYWFVPRQFIAKSFIYIGQPVISFKDNPDTSISTVGVRQSADTSNVDIKQAGNFSFNPTVPDIKTVVNLSTAPGILSSVLQDPSIIASMDEKKITINQFDDMVTSTDIGKDQVSIVVTDTNPQTAVLLANTLASKLVDKVNATYSLGKIADTLDRQVVNAQTDYERAQAALETGYSEIQVDSLKAQSKAKIAELDAVVEAINRNSMLQDDLDSFDDSLKGIPGDSPLSLGDGLALTSLRQNSLSTTSDNPINLQLDGGSFTGTSVAQALETTSQIRTTLQEQAKRLKTRQSVLEKEIPLQQKYLENSQAQINLLITKRDQTSELLQSLVKQQQLISSVLAQSATVASLSVPAVHSNQASSPNVIFNTAVAGAVGFLIALMILYLRYWWQSEDNDLHNPESID